MTTENRNQINFNHFENLENVQQQIRRTLMQFSVKSMKKDGYEYLELIFLFMFGTTLFGVSADR